MSLVAISDVAEEQGQLLSGVYVQSMTEVPSEVHWYDQTWLFLVL